MRILEVGRNLFLGHVLLGALCAFPSWSSGQEAFPHVPQYLPFQTNEVTRDVLPTESHIVPIGATLLNVFGTDTPQSTEVAFEIPQEFRTKEWNLAASADVKCEGDAWLQLKTPNSEQASALCLGGNRNLNLTVLLPTTSNSTAGKVALFAQNGLSVFSNLKLLLYSDARFEHIVDQTHPIGFEKFTENIFRAKTRKIRIGVVGNSTIAGQQPSRYQTIPYLLQMKLETYYPGVFEVTNLGRNASTLLSQNIQFHLDCNFQHFMYPGGREQTFTTFSSFVEKCKAENQQALLSRWSALNIDMFLLGSMWNDLYELHTFENVPLYRSKSTGTALHILYLQALEKYLRGDLSARSQLAMDPKSDANVEVISPEARQVYATDVYAFLLKQFLDDANELGLRSALFTLPEATGNRPDIKNLYSNNPMANIISIDEQIQNSISEIAARNAHVPFVDGTVDYHNLVLSRNLSPKQLNALEYFLAPIGGDLIHMNARGHMMIADMLFDRLHSEFEDLSRRAR